MTQAQLGEAVDRSQSWIAKYENYGGLASHSLVRDLSNALSVPVDTLRRWVLDAAKADAPNEVIDRRVAAYIRRSLRAGDTGWASGVGRLVSK